MRLRKCKFFNKWVAVEKLFSWHLIIFLISDQIKLRAHLHLAGYLVTVVLSSKTPTKT